MSNSSRQPTWYFFAYSLLLTQWTAIQALISGNIQLVGDVMTGGRTQFLPGSYVNTIPRWSVEVTPDNTINIQRLLGSGLSDNNEDVTTLARQFVDPTSNEELWWPCDLSQLQIRPKLEILIKGAIPSYILAGAEVRVPSHVSKDGRIWNNFGMNSQPLASQWTAFQIAVEQGFRVELFVGDKHEYNAEQTKEEQQAVKDEFVTEWKALDSFKNMEDCASPEGTQKRQDKAIKGTQMALDLLGSLLAQLDDSMQFADGMHIISIPMGNEWYDLPALSQDETYQLASIGTSGSDSLELLSMGDELIALSGSSLLRVDVKPVASGSDSEYIPDVYKPLYQ